MTLSRQQFEQAVIDHVDVDDEPYVELMAHDADQRRELTKARDERNELYNSTVTLKGQVAALGQQVEHHQWKQEQNEQEVDRVRQQLEEIEHTLREHGIDIRPDIGLVTGIHILAAQRAEAQDQWRKTNEQYERVSKALARLTQEWINAQAEVESCNRTIAAMAAKASEQEVEP